MLIIRGAAWNLEAKGEAMETVGEIANWGERTLKGKIQGNERFQILVILLGGRTTDE